MESTRSISRSSSVAPEFSFLSFFDSLLQWVQSINYQYIFVVFLQVSFAVAISVTFSFFTVSTIHRYVVPRPLLQEKLYFDFRLPEPVATIKLNSAQNQWNYVGAIASASSPNYQKQSYLLSGRSYDLELRVQFAKSPRNRDLGKVVCSIQMQDATGETIAQSVRTISYLYHSPYFTIVQEMMGFGYEFLGMSGYPLTESVSVSLMENFIEPRNHPPTNTIEIRLSTSEVDLFSANLILAPKMGFFISILYHYPWISCFVSTALLCGVQLWLAVFYFLITYAIKQMTEGNDNAYSSPTSSRRFNSNKDSRLFRERRNSSNRNNALSTRENTSTNDSVNNQINDSPESSSAVIRAQIMADEEVAKLYAAAYADAIDQVANMDEVNAAANVTDTHEHKHDLYAHENNNLRQRRGFRVPDVLSS